MKMIKILYFIRQLDMCFSISYAERNRLEALYGPLRLEPEEIKEGFDKDFGRVYYIDAFSLPKIPVVTNQSPDNIQLLTWGLIPRWVKNNEKAQEIRTRTFNARAETLFEKPSFRVSVKDRRCLILADGFFEWREFQGKNYPYYIRMAHKEPFAIAGIWDIWKDNGDVLRTFSLVTTRANPLLEKIHNKKKRMPAILLKESEKMWLSEDATRDDIVKLLEPIDDRELEAYTVSKLVSARGAKKNVPEALKPHEYPELKFEQSKLF